jgi:hypothetical protein
MALVFFGNASVGLIMLPLMLFHHPADRVRGDRRPDGAHTPAA